MRFLDRIALYLFIFNRLAYAGEYVDYVNQVIPKTFAHADQDAAIREGQVFQERLSSLGAAVKGASENLTLSLQYLGLLKGISDGGEGPLESSELDHALTQLFVTTQALEFLKPVRELALTGEKISQDFNRACDDDRSFLAYDVTNLPLVLYLPGLITNTGEFKFAFAKSPHSVNDNVTMLIPFAETVFSFFSHRSVVTKNEDIALAHELLANGKVTSRDYQEMAKRHCLAYLAAEKGKLLPLEESLKRILSELGRFPKVAVEQWHSYWRDRINLQDGLFPDRFTHRIEAAVNRGLAPELAREESWIGEGGLMRTLHLRFGRLTASPVDEKDHGENQILAEIALLSANDTHSERFQAFLATIAGKVSRLRQQRLENLIQGEEQ
jgi:hypothetical protein